MKIVVAKGYLSMLESMRTSQNGAYSEMLRKIAFLLTGESLAPKDAQRIVFEDDEVRNYLYHSLNGKRFWDTIDAVDEAIYRISYSLSTMTQKRDAKGRFTK